MWNTKIKLEFCWFAAGNQNVLDPVTQIGLHPRECLILNAKSTLQMSDQYWSNAADKSNNTNAAIDPSSKISEISLWTLIRAYINNDTNECCSHIIGNFVSHWHIYSEVMLLNKWVDYLVSIKLIRYVGREWNCCSLNILIKLLLL